MRPYSKYLEKIKNESHRVKWNLAGTTPPLSIAESLLNIQKVSMDLKESRKSDYYSGAKRWISERTAFSEKNIEFFTGSSQAIFQLFASITKPGDQVLIEKPTYGPVLDIAKFLGLKISRFRRTNDFNKDFKNLKFLSKKPKLIFLTNPHCPTGWMLNRDQYRALESLRTPIIIDEIYLPHFSEGEISFASPQSRFLISVSGFSKTVGLSSLRLAWALGPAKYLQDASRIGLNLNVDLPTPSLVIGNAVFKKWDLVIAQLTEICETNRSSLRNVCHTLGHALSHDVSTGNFVMIKMPKGYLSEKTFAARLEEKSIFLRPGSDFEMKNHFRLHLMSAPSEFTKFLSRIVKLYE